MSDDIRQETITVLDWAATVFRAGTAANVELKSLADRLRDPDVALRPTRAWGSKEGEIRKQLVALRDSSSALATLLPDLGYAIPSVDEGFANRIESAALEALRAMAADVTYEQVARSLHGSWGDSDLAEAIQTLARKMSAETSEERAEPSLALAP